MDKEQLVQNIFIESIKHANKAYLTGAIIFNFALFISTDIVNIAEVKIPLIGFVIPDKKLAAIPLLIVYFLSGLYTNSSINTASSVIHKIKDVESRKILANYPSLISGPFIIRWISYVLLASFVTVIIAAFFELHGGYAMLYALALNMPYFLAFQEAKYIRKIAK